MIDVHFTPTPNGHKVSIMLEETGLPHRLISYDMLAGEHLRPEFRAVNPNGRLPAIVDHDPIGGGPPRPAPSCSTSRRRPAAPSCQSTRAVALRLSNG
jgi:GST-like protein